MDHQRLLMIMELLRKAKYKKNQQFLFSRPCMITYFIKKKAVYKHFLLQAKQRLTYPSTQRTKNREKLEKDHENNYLQTSQTKTTEEGGLHSTHQAKPSDRKHPNLHKMHHHQVAD